MFLNSYMYLLILFSLQTVIHPTNYNLHKAVHASDIINYYWNSRDLKNSSCFKE